MIALGSLLVAALMGCGKHGDAAESPPPLLIDERGVTMPFERAVQHIRFHPFLPSRQILAYAVIAPLGDVDNDAHRGIAMEYVANGKAMLLSQWPKQHYTIAFQKNAAELPPCTPQHYAPLGIAWVTPRDVVMTVQPDGNVPIRALDAEARRLLRAGACR